MAFPTSPNNEDYYNGYLYDSAKGAWTTEDGEWHTVGTSGEPAFQNGWSLHSSQVFLKFRKTNDGCIEIIGGSRNGTGTVVFTLPEGFRPGTNTYIPATCYTGSGHVMREVTIGSTGNVSISPVTGIIDFKIYIKFEIGIM